MTKQDFVDTVAGKSGLSKRDASAAVDAFLETVEETLKSGDSVTFTGFGKFHTTHRAARMGVNPRNPTEKVHIKAATASRIASSARRPSSSAASQRARKTSPAPSTETGSTSGARAR